MKRYQWPLLLLILIVAAALRWTGIAWDGYEHYHPDERYIAWVGTTIEFPDSMATALQPDRSSFNPFYWPPDAESEGIVVLQDERRSFAYGHLPLYLGIAATRLTETVAPALRPLLPEGWLLTRDLLNSRELVEFDHLTAVARALTGLVDLLTVTLLFFLGRRLYGVGAGLLAAALLALNVMHVQLAHFFAVDPYLTFFAVLTLYALVVMLAELRRPGGGRPRPFLLLAAVAIGLAVGSKFSAVLLFLPLILALVLDPHVTEQRFTRRLLAAGGIALLTFALTNPFALLDWGCRVITPAMELGPLTIPALNWGNCFLENITRQSAMVRGNLSFPFTRQYVGTIPYLYPIVMQLRWGMGPVLGVVAFAGFGRAGWRGAVAAYRAWRQKRLPIDEGARWVLLAWAVPYFLITGSFFTKFMRYMQPLTPFLMLYAAVLLLAIPWRRVRALLIALVLLASGLYALSFAGMYATPHPWLSASYWLHDNVLPGSLIADEKWDEALPSTVYMDGELRTRGRFDGATLDWLGGPGAGDDREKLAENLAVVAEADYVTVASNRGYGVVGRLPDLYPLSSQYYRLLFAGALGYEPVYVSGRSARLGSLSLWPDRFEPATLTPPPAVTAFLDAVPRLSLGYADESFTVYDQPLVMVFANTGRLSLDEMLAHFDLEGVPGSGE